MAGLLHLSCSPEPLLPTSAPFIIVTCVFPAGLVLPYLPFLVHHIPCLHTASVSSSSRIGLATKLLDNAQLLDSVTSIAFATMSSSHHHHHSSSSRRSDASRSDASRSSASRSGTSSSDATRNFRPNYQPRVTEPQREQFRRDQEAYDRIPSGTLQEGARIAERMDTRRQEWEQRHRVREEVYDNTETARMERRGRDDPDIQARK